MLYTSKEDRLQIKKELKKLLLENDTNLKQFCDNNGLIYATVCNWFKGEYRAPHDKIQEMISKVDKGKFLQRVNGKMVIAKKY